MKKELNIKLEGRSKVLAIIQRYGPITSASISFHLGMKIGCVNYHLGQLGEEAYIADWEPRLASNGQRRWAGKWSAGLGENMPQPKNKPIQPRDYAEVDLAAMPYRSVFAGGVSPWVGMERAA